MAQTPDQLNVPVRPVIDLAELERVCALVRDRVKQAFLEGAQEAARETGQNTLARVDFDADAVAAAVGGYAGQAAWMKPE